MEDQTKRGDIPFWWPDARGWIAVAVYSLVIYLVTLIVWDRTLVQNEFFKLIAQGVIIQGLLTTVVSYYYTASKSTADARDQLAKQTEQTHKALDLAAAAQPAIAVVAADNVQITPAAAAPVPWAYDSAYKAGDKVTFQGSGFTALRDVEAGATMIDDVDAWAPDAPAEPGATP